MYSRCYSFFTTRSVFNYVFFAVSCNWSKVENAITHGCAKNDFASRSVQPPTAFIYFFYYKHTLQTPLNYFIFSFVWFLKNKIVKF